MPILLLLLLVLLLVVVVVVVVVLLLLLLLLLLYAGILRSLCDVFCLTCIRDPCPARLAHLSTSQILPKNSTQAIDKALASTISELAPHAADLAAAATVTSSSTKPVIGVADTTRTRIAGRSSTPAVSSYWREGVLPLLGSSGS